MKYHQRPRLTTKETADLIGCAISTLKISRVSGILFGVEAPKYRKMGRKVLYERIEVDEWLKQFSLFTSTAHHAESTEVSP